MHAKPNVIYYSFSYFELRFSGEILIHLEKKKNSVK